MPDALSFDLIARGGVVMGVLAALSLLALTIAIAKLVQLARMRVWSRGWLAELEGLLDRGDHGAALELSERSKGPVARVVALALRESQREDLSPDALREEIQRAGDRELAALESQLRGLDTVGTLAPLLGLLGTVLGMIRAFMNLEQAGAGIDAALLSGGIWEALLTTAAGIAIAVPTLGALAWFEAQIDGVRRRMADAATRVLTAPKSDSAPGLRRAL